MARLSEQLRDWLARAEILARGVEKRRLEAVRALDAGRPWHARYEALSILEQLPSSPLALALWADAAEAMYLDHEAVEALERLAGEVPFRADVWLRLFFARSRMGHDAADALARAVEAAEPTDAADQARLLLADRDLARADAQRAERWLDQLSLASRRSAEAQARRIEIWLALGESKKAKDAIVLLGEPQPLDGHAWLLRARAIADADADRAAQAFRRALILNAPQAERHAAHFVAEQATPSAVETLRDIVESLGRLEAPLWRAAFAIADGHPEQALRALGEGARADPELFARYLQSALAARDLDAFADAVELARQSGRELDAGVLAVAAALGAEGDTQRLEYLDRADGAALELADVLRSRTYAPWWPIGTSANWGALLREFGSLSQALGCWDSLRDLEAIAVDLERPLRVAIVGEFNAGKSSFINALLGEAVAPVGVLPTTATQNRLVWAPDRFVRIERSAGSSEPDRVVAPSNLETTLRSLDPMTIAHVTIYAPLELLRRVELIDTPGFNAPEPIHVARARAAFEHAHVALWLFDGAQPLKETERALLAEISGLGIPLLVLLNKVDRLLDTGAAAVERALAFVREGLEQTGLTPLSQPIALSTRWALTARQTGDASLLERSNWPEVERLVGEQLVDRSAELREGALRRRARTVVAALVERVARERGTRETELARLEQRRDRLSARIGALRDGSESVRAALERTLAGALRELEKDVRPVSSVAADNLVSPFVAARARRLIGTSLERTMKSELGWQDVEPALSAELLARFEAIAAAAAPLLLARRSRKEPAEHHVEHAHLARLAHEEALRVLERELSTVKPPKQPAVERRVLALAACLGVDGVDASPTGPRRLLLPVSARVEAPPFVERSVK
jgi:GTP-binding protein EngB required for normal cell division